MYQCTGLVQVRQCKTDAELNRCQGYAAFQDTIGIVRVIFLDGSITRIIIRGFAQFCNQGCDHAVFYRHMIGCGLAVFVEINTAHIQRVATQLMGDVIYYALNRHHALGAAKTAIGGGRLGVGF